MKKKLIFVYQLYNDNHVSVEFSPYSFVLKEYYMGVPLIVGKPKDGVYPWPSKSALQVASIDQVNTSSTTTALNWHHVSGILALPLFVIF